MRIHVVMPDSRPTLSKFQSFKIRRLTFPNHIKYGGWRILRQKNVKWSVGEDRKKILVTLIPSMIASELSAGTSGEMDTNRSSYPKLDIDSSLLTKQFVQSRRKPAKKSLARLISLKLQPYLRLIYEWLLSQAHLWFNISPSRRCYQRRRVWTMKINFQINCQENEPWM